jgi:CubicO group peptidase (beta-lactamase class C family)
VTIEQLMAMQAQLMQTVMDRLGEQPAGGRPPVFTHASDPMEADDWLRAVEKQLSIAQCNDLEKVLYVSGQL